MRQIISYLKAYVQSNFNMKLYASISVFLILFISLNYYYDFEDSVLDSYAGTLLGTCYFFLFHILPYLFVCLLIYWFDRDQRFFSQKGFWLAVVIGFLALAIDRSLNWYVLIGDMVPYQPKMFIYKCVNNLSTLIVISVPLYAYYRLDKAQDHFYGVTLKNLNLRPYFILLLLVVPLVVGASFSDDFLKQYPMYQRVQGGLASEFLDMSEYLVAASFELSYALSFFSVELFFRGFLIFALVRYVGPNVVLPMVVTYAFLHFGKPLGETVGSIFGGYILGIVALHSRNIWGGVIVHAGLALMMELVAWLQRAF